MHYGLCKISAGVVWSNSDFDGRIGLIGCNRRSKVRKGNTPSRRYGCIAIEEAAELSFASTNKNMHACGHDLHTAMLLGAAEILKAKCFTFHFYTRFGIDLSNFQIGMPKKSRIYTGLIFSITRENTMGNVIFNKNA